ncbi:4'-phosphopantetheinyl transferase family protein [Streptomyces sp. NBC_00029]|uniref:4'-phosphopantetheinyl transferase family protein n=1 Tax=Streptomyces sp. NBC_00029 TaxID=2903613 RepID=UPI0038651200
MLIFSVAQQRGGGRGGRRDTALKGYGLPGSRARQGCHGPGARDFEARAPGFRASGLQGFRASGLQGKANLVRGRGAEGRKKPPRTVHAEIQKPQDLGTQERAEPVELGPARRENITTQQPGKPGNRPPPSGHQRTPNGSRHGGQPPDTGTDTPTPPPDRLVYPRSDDHPHQPTRTRNTPHRTRTHRHTSHRLVPRHHRPHHRRPPHPRRTHHPGHRRTHQSRPLPTTRRPPPLHHLPPRPPHPPRQIPQPTPQHITLTREPCPTCGGPHGRPALTHPNLHFSLSHSGNLAYIALAATPVGIDIEQTPTPQTVNDIINTLHPTETTELNNLTPDQQPPALARLWARKEACLKATGTGLSQGLTHPYVSTHPTPPPTPGWTLTDLPTPHGYTAALAQTQPPIHAPAL